MGEFSSWPAESPFQDLELHEGAVLPTILPLPIGGHCSLMVLGAPVVLLAAGGTNIRHCRPISTNKQTMRGDETQTNGDRACPQRRTTRSIPAIETKKPFVNENLLVMKISSVINVLPHCRHLHDPYLVLLSFHQSNSCRLRGFLFLCGVPVPRAGIANLDHDRKPHEDALVSLPSTSSADSEEHPAKRAQTIGASTRQRQPLRQVGLLSPATQEEEVPPTAGETGCWPVPVLSLFNVTATTRDSSPHPEPDEIFPLEEQACKVRHQGACRTAEFSKSR